MKPVPLIVGTVTLAAGVAFLSVRVLMPPQPVPANAGHHAYAGIDASDGFLPHLPEAAHAVTGLAAALDTHDRITVFSISSDLRELYDDTAPESVDDFQDGLVGELQASPTRKGTFPAPFWSAMADRAAKDTGTVSVSYLSDGDNDDQSRASAESIMRSAEKLAKNPRVKAVTIFAAPENWAAIRSEFSGLGARLHLSDCREVSPECLTGPVLEGRG